MVAHAQESMPHILEQNFGIGKVTPYFSKTQ